MQLPNDIPPRPKFPNEATEARSERQLLRFAMLSEDFQQQAADWIKEAFGPVRSKAFGLVDTSQAPLPTQTRQLVTPGLYGRTPTATGEDAGDRMLDPHHGVLKQCGYWSRMAHVEYMTVGMGVYALRLNAVGTGKDARPVLRNAEPHNLEVYCSDADPLTPVTIWELKLRPLREPHGIVWGWFFDVFDISDPDNPTFEIHRAQVSGGLGDKVTSSFLEEETSGEAYPWRRPDNGAPFLPYAWYRAVNQGIFWPNYRNGMHQGTLRSCALWTFAEQSAYFASGEHNLVGGVSPDAFPSSTTAGENNEEETFVPVHTFDATPGAVTVIPTIDDRPLQVFQLKAGINLNEIASFVSLYGRSLSRSDGLPMNDSTLRANPSSGSALVVSNADRRAHTWRTEPMFFASDTDAIQKLAWIMEIATGEPHTSEGYAIEYHTLPLSPEEKQDQREDLEWQQAQGQLSPIDLHLALHPTRTRSQAIDAIVAARADEVELSSLVDVEIARRGLEPVAEPEENPDDPGQAGIEPEESPTEEDEI